jgi:hypothetical protein
MYMCNVCMHARLYMYDARVFVRVCVCVCMFLLCVSAVYTSFVCDTDHIRFW